MSTITELRRRRVRLVQQVHRSRTAAEVFATASHRLDDIVPHDAAAFLGTDPGTGLPTSPVRIDDLDGVTQAQCARHWEHELLSTDANLFRDLSRADEPAASLRRSVADLEQSPRYRRFLRPLGLTDELRAVLRVGDASWGTITLWRREGRPPFSDLDASLLAALSAPMGEALRRHARPAIEPPDRAEDHPGLIVFDDESEVVSANDGARQWLERLPSEPGVPSRIGPLPIWLLIAVFRAGAIRNGVGDGTARTRVRTRDGRWLTCHASCLRGADGTTGDVAMVIEPAAPGAVAPILVEAYDLTPREQEIVGLLVRGAGTREIADELYLSPHTVRDHVKSIFAKAAVSSRGELVAKLFGEHYEPLHRAGIVRARRDEPGDR